MKSETQQTNEWTTTKTKNKISIFSPADEDDYHIINKIGSCITVKEKTEK